MPRKIMSGSEPSEVKEEVKSKVVRRAPKKTVKEADTKEVQENQEVQEVQEVKKVISLSPVKEIKEEVVKETKEESDASEDSDGWDETVAQPVTIKTTQQSSNSRSETRPTQYSSQHSSTRPSTRPTQNQLSKRPKSTALSFAYKDYSNFQTPASEASTPDLLRVLIVRAHEDGQVHLKRCLENTLKAVNLECKFPTLPPFRSGPKYQQREQDN